MQQDLKAGTRGGICRAVGTLLALLLLGALGAGCEVWNIEKGLKQVGHEILEAEGLGMEEAALYHLNVARSLLAAARKQYEEADYTASGQFLEQSKEQLRRAQDLYALSGSAPPRKNGQGP